MCAAQRPDPPPPAEPVAPRYGRGLLAELPAELLARPLVLTQAEPWALLRDAFTAPAAVDRVASMEAGPLEARCAGYPEASAVFGIGGGTALDAAKHAAWRRGWPLVLMPSILSVDAAFTSAVGVRRDGRVRYEGSVRPDYLLIDFDLLAAAPPRLNRAGVGDLLSIHTALGDWQQASRRLGEAHDPAAAAEAAALLERVLAAPAAIRACGPEGLRLLAESFAAEVALCQRVGSARPEEGSEHHLAYCLEQRSGRGYLHGALIGLCTLLASAHQGRDPSRLADFLRAIELDCRPAALGTDWAALADALCAMGDYVRAEPQLQPGAFHFSDGVAPERAAALIARVRELLG
jgi:glycerol-1-phosphate dehydrogenase [NAD(P)+]